MLFACLVKLLSPSWRKTLLFTDHIHWVNLTNLAIVLIVSLLILCLFQAGIILISDSAHAWLMLVLCADLKSFQSFFFLIFSVNFSEFWQLIRGCSSMTSVYFRPFWSPTSPPPFSKKSVFEYPPLPPPLLASYLNKECNENHNII